MNRYRLWLGGWVMPSFAAWLLCMVAVASAQELPVKDTNNFTFVIHSSLPPFRFHLLRSTNDYPAILGMEVFRGDDARPWQILTNELEQSTSGEWKQLAVEDANFDGYRDLMAVNWYGVTGNIGYNFWLFNTNSGRFEFSGELSELCSPEFDASKKRIGTHAKSSMGIFSEATYEWERGKLKIIGQYWQDYERRPVRQWLSDHIKVKWLKYEPELIYEARVWTNGSWKVKSGRVPEG